VSRVIAVPCLGDNYAYLVVGADGHRAVVVDPSEAEPVARALAREGLALTAILNTHHHWDHVGGNEALAAAWPGLAVYAHASDWGRVPRQTERVEHERPFEVASFEVRPLHVPGHTLGAVAYCIDDAVFTGDTLFVAGCGRLFEGTAEMMLGSLADKLGRLPGATRVYCGHEYTVKNLEFAATAEPDNARIQERLAWARERRRQGLPTVPSSLGDELATNPFLRCAEPSVAGRWGGGAPAEVLAAVRRAKDRF
jgi:hydroxyacylglutathione hydrolase